MKQQLNNIHTLWFPAVFAVLIFAGCAKRNLELKQGEGEGNVNISLYWEESEHPESVRFLFYNESGDLIKEQSGITDGFNGGLPDGKYRLVVHSTNAVNVDYNGMDRYESAEVFALEDVNKSDSRAPGNIPVILEPKDVYGVGRCREFEVIEILKGKTCTATVAPKMLTHQVKLDFKILGNTLLKSLSGYINGVSPSVLLSTGVSTSTIKCSTPFVGQPDGSLQNYTVEMVVFNLLTGKDAANSVNISLIEENGTSHQATFDITKVVEDIIKENGGIIPIEIPIEVEIEIKALGALTITVTPWKEGNGEVDFE